MEETGVQQELESKVETEVLTSLRMVLDFLKNLDFKKHFENIDLRTLLLKGYVRSGSIKIAKNLEIEVRTLLMEEWIICKELSEGYKSAEGKQHAFMVEYLVYSLITLNGAQLVMDQKEIDEFKKRNGRDPSLEEQARYVLRNVLPPFLIEILWVVAWKFKQDFEEVFVRKVLDDFKSIMEERNAITRIGR